MYFDVVQGNITRQTDHGLANTIGPTSQMDCGVSKEFRAHTNGQIVDDIAKERSVEHGDVVVTEAYDLPALYLFHAVPVTQDGTATETGIRTAARTVLEKADELDCRSLVLPLLGCGGGGYELEAGDTCMCEEIWQFDPNSLADVRVIGHSESDFNTLRRVARDVKAPSERR